MYGFHKINRTPRAQRASTDSQTWEFSHHKFLRGRPDLLDEIRRKALETTAGTSAGVSGERARIELPGEVARLVGELREEGERMRRELERERERRGNLEGVVRRLWEMVGEVYPGGEFHFSYLALDG